MYINHSARAENEASHCLNDGAQLPNVTTVCLTVPNVANMLSYGEPLPPPRAWQTCSNGVEFRIGFGRGHDDRFIASCGRHALWLSAEIRNPEVEVFFEVVIMDPVDHSKVLDRRMEVSPNSVARCYGRSGTTLKFPLLCAPSLECNSLFIDAARQSTQSAHRRPWKNTPKSVWKDMIVQVHAVPLVPVSVQAPGSSGIAQLEPTATDKAQTPSVSNIAERIAASIALCRSVYALKKHHREYPLFFNVEYNLSEACNRLFGDEVEEIDQNEAVFPALLNAYSELAADGCSVPKLVDFVKRLSQSHAKLLVNYCLNPVCSGLAAVGILSCFSSRVNLLRYVLKKLWLRLCLCSRPPTLSLGRHFVCVVMFSAEKCRT